MMLDGKLLYVVQNQSNLIAIFHLSDDLRKATYITAIDDPGPRRADDDRSRRQPGVRRQRPLRTATPADQHYDIVKAGDG